jgi:hypothetical protein
VSRDQKTEQSRHTKTGNKLLENAGKKSSVLWQQQRIKTACKKKLRTE